MKATDRIISGPPMSPGAPGLSAAADETWEATNLRPPAGAPSLRFFSSARVGSITNRGLQHEGYGLQPVHQPPNKDEGFSP